MQSAPPPPPVGPYPWSQPPLPPKKDALPILVLVLVVVLVIGLLFAALVAYFFLPLSRTPFQTAPSVSFGPVRFSLGNATFDIASVSTPGISGGFFRVNLGVGSVVGVAQPIAPNQGYSIVRLASDRFRVYFAAVGGSSVMDAGGRFVVAGNGTPLPAATPFTFYLLWIFDGKTIASTNWTTESRPVVTFTAVTQSSGNASIGVAGASRTVLPSNYKVNLKVGGAIGTAVAMPAVGTGTNNYVTVDVAATNYRVYWTDIGGENTLNAGDMFRITGNNTALPAATSLTFYLVWSDDSPIQSTSWSTP